jgi:hypothetical protein
MPKKFTLEFLNKICDEKGITLLQKYSENELNSQKFIDFICIKCKGNTSKRFEFIIKYNAFCHSCSYNGKGIKARNTMLIKYGVENISQLDYIKNKKKETTFKNFGVEHNSQSQIIKNKKVETTFKNFGVEYPQQSKEIRDKGKITCFNNYGVDHPAQSDEIREKYKITCLKKYGVEHNFQSKEIRDKGKNTFLKKYGVEHPSQTKEFKDKYRLTSLKNYGVEHPQQNTEFAEKSSKNCYKSKIFTFPSGNEIKCQGYEPFAFKELVENNINEIEIKTGAKNVPTIWYDDLNGKKHRHYVDIFVPLQNKCIEVKSTWTAEKKKDCIFLKQNAAKELGYEYEIWVYDNNGNKVNYYT